MSEATFGQRVAFLRKCAGLTQRELSEELGGAPDLVWRWESGRNAPHINRQLEITRIVSTMSSLRTTSATARRA